MRRLFPDRSNERLNRLRLFNKCFAVVWIVLVSSLYQYPWVAAGVGALLVIGYLHHLSLGRTTPLVVFSFIAFAFLAGLVASFPYLIAEMEWTESARQITDHDIFIFFIKIGSLSLVVSAFVAAFAAMLKRDEWFNHLW